MSITVNVKTMSGGSPFSITAELKSSLADLKTKVEDKLGLSGRGVRLVSHGKVLKEDAATLSSNGVKDGAIIVAVPTRVVRTAEEEAAAQKAKYAELLEELHSMGFEDEKQCLAALNKHNGDLDLAVSSLAEDPNESPPHAQQQAGLTPSTCAKDSVGTTVASAGYEVVANVYDISGGMARMCSQQMIGKFMEFLPHTGIVVFGQEYFCSQQPAVSEPGKSLPSPVIKTLRLGSTSKTKEELVTFLVTLKTVFTPSTYDFMTKNSNHYADAVAKFLLDGSGLPQELLSLSEDMNASPQGRQMAAMMGSMQANNRSFFTPTGTMFHGGTPANPAMAQMFSGCGAGQPSAMNAGYAANSAAPAGGPDPCTRFKAELEELKSMGFSNQDACLRALVQANGDIGTAVDIVFASSPP